MNNSITLMGAIIGDGSTKLFTQPFTPFAWIPEYSTRIMLITASAAVTFNAFVGVWNQTTRLNWQFRYRLPLWKDRECICDPSLPQSLQRNCKVLKRLFPTSAVSFRDFPLFKFLTKHRHKTTSTAHDNPCDYHCFGNTNPAKYRNGKDCFAVQFL